MSFGAGIHSCLGLALARLEARVVLTALLDRAPKLSLADHPMVWQERVQFRGPKELWVHRGDGLKRIESLL